MVVAWCMSDLSCDDALANRPLRLWERALGAWSPHPIVEGMAEEMHCFGP